MPYRFFLCCRLLSLLFSLIRPSLLIFSSCSLLVFSINTLSPSCISFVSYLHTPLRFSSLHSHSLLPGKLIIIVCAIFSLSLMSLAVHPPYRVMAPDCCLAFRDINELVSGLLCSSLMARTNIQHSLFLSSCVLCVSSLHQGLRPS